MEKVLEYMGKWVDMRAIEGAGWVKLVIEQWFKLRKFKVLLFMSPDINLCFNLRKLQRKLNLRTN